MHALTRTLSVAGLLLGAWTCPAAAGPAEVLRDVVFHPTQPDSFAAVYAEVGGGLVITQDGGESFTLLCNAAVTGSDSRSGLTLAASWTRDGRLLVGNFDGLFRSEPGGCGFQAVEALQGLYVRQIVADPDDPGTLYVVTARGDAQNGLFVSEDDGGTWRPLHTADGNSYYRVTLDAPNGGPQRIAAGVAKRSDGRTDFAYLVSTDDGASFSSHPLPEAHDARFLGFDRALPERTYAAIVRADSEPTEIVVRDAEPSAWETVTKVWELGSFVIEADGGFSVVDAATDRLERFDAALDARPRVGAVVASCFAARKGTSGLICQGHLLRRVTPQGSLAPAPLLDLNEVAGFFACDGGPDVASACAPAVEAGYCHAGHYPGSPLCAAQRGGADSAGDGVGTFEDAGHARPRDASPADSDAPGSGCQAGPNRPPAGAGPLAALLAGLLLDRVRRRAARGPQTATWPVGRRRRQRGRR